MGIWVRGWRESWHGAVTHDVYNGFLPLRWLLLQSHHRQTVRVTLASESTALTEAHARSFAK